MAREFDPHKLSNPSVFLLSMIIFLIITGFLASILYLQIFEAFQTNPGLNGVILGVLVVGILLSLIQVMRLIPEVRWVNGFRLGNPDLETNRGPVLLAPMKELLGQTGQDMSICPSNSFIGANKRIAWADRAGHVDLCDLYAVYP